jgi:hypothetical protein
MFDLTRRLAHSHMDASQADTAALTAKGQDELIDDVLWYTHIDNLYLNDYLVWRLQGIFESLITTFFLPQSPQQHWSGLKSRLNAMKKVGYTIAHADEEELLAWAKLRNALSHALPGGYQPFRIYEEDLLQYKDLLKRQCKHWRVEQDKLNAEKEK